MLEKFRKRTSSKRNSSKGHIRNLRYDVGLNFRDGSLKVDMDIDEYTCTINCNEWEVVLTHGQAGLIFEMLSHVYGIKDLTIIDEDRVRWVEE